MNALTLGKVIGDRGACGYAPENTLASFKQAKAFGVNWVEFDVQLTADLQPIIFHDDTLDRVTNGKGAVMAATSEQVSRLDLQIAVHQRGGHVFGKDVE